MMLGVAVSTYRGHVKDPTSANNDGGNHVVVSWSPDGKHIASGCIAGTVHVWESMTGVQTNAYITTRFLSRAVYTIQWSPDGRYIASGLNEGNVQVWDFRRGSRIYTFKNHRSDVHSLSWSPDSKQIASASTDKTVRIWNALTGKSALFTTSIYQQHKYKNSVMLAVAWSPDGRHIASGDVGQEVQVWSAKSGYKVTIYKEHTGPISSLAWSPDGRRLASASGVDPTIRVWNPLTGSSIMTCQCRWANGRSGILRHISWSPDGRYILCAAPISIWDTTTGHAIFTDQELNASSAEWSPDGRYIAIGNTNGTAEIIQMV